MSCGESEQSGALAELFHVDNSVLELLIIDVAPRVAGLKKSKWTGYSVSRRLNYFIGWRLNPAPHLVVVILPRNLMGKSRVKSSALVVPLLWVWKHIELYKAMWLPVRSGLCACKVELYVTAYVFPDYLLSRTKNPNTGLENPRINSMCWYHQLQGTVYTVQ